MSLRRCIAVLCLFLSPISFAADGYYQSKERGWFWYEREPEVVEPEIKEPIEPPPVVVAEPEEKEPEPEEKPAVVKLDTVWLRDNMDSALMKAIDEPTMANVSVYLYMQRLMVERSANFTKAAQEAYAATPWLANEARNPQSQGAKQLMTSRAAANTTELMKSLGKDTRLYYLVDSECYACAYQVNAMLPLRTRGFEIVIASIDGAAPQGVDVGSLASIDSLPKAVANYPYKRTPALIAVHKEEAPVHVSASLLSASDLERNFLLIAKHRGWVSQQQFAKTKPTNEVELAVSSDTTVPEDLLENSELFVEFLKNQIQVDNTNEN